MIKKLSTEGATQTDEIREAMVASEPNSSLTISARTYILVFLAVFSVAAGILSAASMSW